MRFLTFANHGVETVGVRLGDSVVNLRAAAPHLPGTLRGLIRENRLAEAADIARSAPEATRLRHAGLHHLPLLPQPTKMLNLIGSGDLTPKYPGLSVSVANRLCGHFTSMIVPRRFGMLDAGVELAIIIGKGGRHIEEAAVADHIAGYAIFIGGVVRGVPAGQTVAVARNSDRSAAFGPELVTPDELPPLAAGLHVELKRNGVVVQSGSTDDLWKVANAVARLSTHMTLEAGDVITTGSFPGSLAESGGYLRAGEVLSARIDGLGLLCSPIADETNS